MAEKSDRLLKGLTALLEALDRRGRIEVKGRRGMMGADVEYRYSVRYLTPFAETKLNRISPGEVEGQLIDVFDGGDYISIVALIPNIKEENLKFKVDKDTIRITANIDGEKVEKELFVQKNDEVDKVSWVSFKNGVFEVRLKKKQSLEPRK